jgi:hypothetical protein
MANRVYAPLVLAAIVWLTAGPGWASGPRCAYVDVDPVVHSPPREQCFGMNIRCAEAERAVGCFKAPLQFKPGFVNRPGEAEMRETAAPFGFIDPLEVHWDVPAGFATDGASIPPALKPILGGSWHRNYLRAAVLHDFYIRRMTAHPEQVHRLFFHALLASGTPFDLASIMYKAVLRYGPRWTMIELAAYERRRQQNLQLVEQQNAVRRRQYEDCLKRNYGRLQAAATAEWFRCALHEDQFVPDLVRVIEDVGRSTWDDFTKGTCVEVAKDKFECPALDLTEEGRRR